MPWDTLADGGLEDLSLALIDNTIDNNSASNWQTQCVALYTPGYDNDFACLQTPSSDCADYISKMGFPLITSDTSAVISIETNGTVLSGSNVYFNAGQEIELLNGFEVEMSAIFEATISPCQ